MTLNSADPCGRDYTAAVLQKMAERHTLCPSQAEQSEQAAKQAKRFLLALAAAIINAPQQADAIKGVIPSSGIVVIYGPSGSGKSFLALYMAEMNMQNQRLADANARQDKQLAAVDARSKEELAQRLQMHNDTMALHRQQLGIAML